MRGERGCACSRRLIETIGSEIAGNRVIGMNATAQDVMRLPGALDLAAAEGFLETIRQRLKGDPALCLDASDVETLTLPSIQIILAAVAAHDVSIANPSVAFSSAFQDLALHWDADAGGGSQDDVPANVAPADKSEPTDEAAMSLAPDASPAAAPAEQPVHEPVQQPAHEPVHVLEPTDVPAVSLVPQEADAPSPVGELMHETAPCAPDASPVPASANEPMAEVTRESEPTRQEAAVHEPEPLLPPDTAQASTDIPTPAADKVVAQEPILAPTDGPSMSKRILTIDDSKTMRDMLLMTLAEAGFDVLQAVDGQDGLDVLGKERVDVVITDINMPIMDGYEVIRNLRKNPVHKTTPILVLTTESDAEKKVIARDAGATGWMVKPFDPDRLIATIRKVAP
jgi:two-component system chemotaxis response regulator CheY